MQMRPRQQLLEIWRSIVEYAYGSQEWNWTGRADSNSISDAELLLCILYPATNVPALRFDRADQTAEDVLRSLGGLGTENEVARVVVRVLTEYMERYSDAEGRPTFASGGYLEPETPGDETTQEQLDLELVDSYSMSVSLGLSVIGFLQVLKGGIRNERTLEQIERLRELSSLRLTAAMTGLLRSFSVRVFTYDSPEGGNLCRMINQSKEPDHRVAERLSERLTDVRSRLREELKIGSGVVADELEDESKLFEVGWAWGIVQGAQPVIYTENLVAQPEGVAEDRPYLYFTGVALDGIEDLFTLRTRILGLLDETQQRLAQALQLRFDLTLSFWNRLATFNERRWPVEDVPWMTTDGVSSDYYSLFVSSMVAQSMVAQRTTTLNAYSEDTLVRLTDLLAELASRGRITRRNVADDQVLRMHQPGIPMRLEGSDKLGPAQTLLVASYSSLLLKRAVRLVSMVTASDERDRLTDLADDIWQHLLARRMDSGPGTGLWDQPVNVFPDLAETSPRPSWYHTQRVVECLVAASWAMDVPPRPSDELVDTAREYLIEAEHLFDRMRLYGREAEGEAIRKAFLAVEANLRRARALLLERPGTAGMLAQQVLRDLDQMERSRTGDSVRPG